jgi:hypothetical protein
MAKEIAGRNCLICKLVEEQSNEHDVFAVALKVTVPEGVAVGGAGMTQLIWQFAACELHDIMQFVTVEVIAVESPTGGLRHLESKSVPAQHRACHRRSPPQLQGSQIPA